jgi:hypothetical protein
MRKALGVRRRGGRFQDAPIRRPRRAFVDRLRTSLECRDRRRRPLVGYVTQAGARTAVTAPDTQARRFAGSLAGLMRGAVTLSLAHRDREEQHGLPAVGQIWAAFL